MTTGIAIGVTFDSLLDYPEHAMKRVRNKIKDCHGVDMAESSVAGIICEFLIGMKELGYTDIELNSTSIGP